MHTVSSSVSGSATGNIIYEGHDCILTLVSIDQETCKIQIENNSSKDYAFSIHSFAANGIMTDFNLYEGYTDVPSEKKGLYNLTFSDFLEDYKGSEPISNISMLIWVYDNAVSYKDFETNLITINIDPTVESNTLLMGADVIEDSGLSFSAISFTDDAITIAVINNNSYYVNFDLESTSVNGWALDTGISVYDVDLFPGCQSIFEVSFEDLKEQAGLSEITDFEFALDVSKADSYDKELTGKITFAK